MPARNKKDAPEVGSFAQKLATAVAPEGDLNLQSLDGLLLYVAVVACAEQGATLTIGVTQAKDAWAVTVWDGKYPRKDYFRDTASFNHYLAVIVRVAYGNRVEPDLEQRLQEYQV